MKKSDNITPSQFEIAITHERIAQSERANAIAKQNIMTVTKLWKAIPDASNDHIIAIEKYKCLLERFLSAKCGHFASLDAAIDAVDEDNILVYITELQLYGTFTFDNYMSFVDNIVMNVKAPIEYTPKQITLSGFPQRVVFICANNEDTIMKIREYCKMHFDSEICTHNAGTTTEVIVRHPIVGNLEEAKREYSKFVAFINEKRRGANVALAMRPLTIETVNGRDFVTNTISDHIDYATKDDVKHQLNGIPLTVNVNICTGGTQTITSNSNNNSNNGIILANDGVIKNNAKEWVKKNPPKNSELKSEYYCKYCRENRNCLSEIKFSKLVAATLPCETKKSNGKTMWIYPKAKYTK